MQVASIIGEQKNKEVGEMSRRMMVTVVLVLVASFVWAQEVIVDKFYYPDDVELVETNGSVSAVHRSLPLVQRDGFPLVPEDRVLVLVPPGSSISKVEILGWDTVVVAEDVELGMSKEEVLSMSGRGGSSEPEPVTVKLGEVVSITRWRGQRVLNVALYPVLPKGDTLLMVKHIRVRVELAESKGEHRTGWGRGGKYAVRRFFRVFDNGVDIDESAPVMSDAVDFVIITSKDLASHFEPLKMRRTLQGLSTKIVTLDWIYENFDGRDPQERIRNFIKYAYLHWGVTFLLLGGSCDVIPARYVEVPFWFYRVPFPTDLYYADMDGDWDANRNGVFGERDDNVDGMPDLFLGRVPIDTPEELHHWLTRVFEYEKFGWEKERVFLGASIIGANRDRIGQIFCERILRMIGGRGFRLYNPSLILWGDSLGDMVLNRENALNVLKDAGLVFHVDHGDITWWGTGIMVGGGMVYDSDAGIGNVGIIYTMSCYGNAYDYHTNTWRWITGDKGAVAIVGNSRIGTTGQFYQARLFFKALFVDSVHYLGEAFASTQCGGSSYYRDVIHLTGDPTMPVYIAPPETVYLDAEVYEDSLVVDVGRHGVLVSVGRGDTVLMRGETDSDGRAVFYTEGIVGEVWVSAFGPGLALVVDTLELGSDSDILPLALSPLPSAPSCTLDLTTRYVVKRRGERAFKGELMLPEGFVPLHVETWGRTQGDTISFSYRFVLPPDEGGFRIREVVVGKDVAFGREFVLGVEKWKILLKKAQFAVDKVALEFVNEGNIPFEGCEGKLVFANGSKKRVEIGEIPPKGSLTEGFAIDRHHLLDGVVLYLPGGDSALFHLAPGAEGAARVIRISQESTENGVLVSWQTSAPISGMELVLPNVERYLHSSQCMLDIAPGESVKVKLIPIDTFYNPGPCTTVVVWGGMELLCDFQLDGEITRMMNGRRVRDRSGLKAGDIDGDGVEEVVAIMGCRLYAFSELMEPMWDLEFPYPLEVTPAVADIDGDGKEEIIVSASSFDSVAVYIVDGDGKVVKTLGHSGAVSSPLVWDINGDGKLEICVGAWNDSVYVWDADGKTLPGWPVFVKKAGAISPAPDGIIVTEPPVFRIWRFNAQGKPVEGWPVRSPGYLMGGVALIDIDGDGEGEAVAGGFSGHVCAWELDGTIVKGFPRKVRTRFVTTPVPFDPDGDGKEDFLLQDRYGKVYWWNGYGQIVRILADAHLPETMVNEIHPLVVDVNADGICEIVVAGGDGWVYAFTPNGEVVEGFPLYYGEFTSSTPLITNDGKLVVRDGRGRLRAWRCPNVGEGKWRMFRHTANNDALSSGAFRESFTIGGGIMVRNVEMPTRLYLFQNSPNPFGEYTEIKFSLPPDGGKKRFVTLNIYDASGRLVCNLVKGLKEPGFYRVRWNGTNSRGQRLPSGLYFYQLKTDDGISLTRSLLLIH